jgi:hypothetical protein
MTPNLLHSPQCRIHLHNSWHHSNHHQPHSDPTRSHRYYSGRSPKTGYHSKTTPAPRIPRLSLSREHHFAHQFRDSKDYDPERVQHASPSAATPSENTMGTCGDRQTCRTTSVTNRITMPSHIHWPTYSSSNADTSSSTGFNPDTPILDPLPLQPTHISEHVTSRAASVSPLHSIQLLARTQRTSEQHPVLSHAPERASPPDPGDNSNAHPPPG